MIKITDYERIACVPVTQLGQIECPKCKGVCNERNGSKKREWDCIRCGRGWVEVPAHVKSVAEAHLVAEQ